MISLDGGAGVGDFGVGGGVGGVGGLGVGGGVGTALWPLTDPLEECTWKGPAEVTQGITVTPRPHSNPTQASLNCHTTIA